jgi:glycosyltransferase involved in cell wall biosynthesis
VSVVVPALNEQDCIGWVLDQVPSWVSEIVLVDGLSTDATERVARSSRPEIVVVHQRRQGKGAALRAGFAAARSDIVVMLDADGSTDPTELPQFVAALEAGADFVKGSRHLPGGGSEDFTLLRRAGNRVLVAMANAMFGSRFTDLCYGYCAFWRRHNDALMLTADGFEIETQLAIRAIKAELDIHEVPSFELMRRAGKSNLNAYHDGRRVLATMLREWLRRGSREVDKRGARIDLVPSEVASHRSFRWRPAGHDRRRRERRELEAHARLHTGVERRRVQRRVPASATMRVLVVPA